MMEMTTPRIEVATNHGVREVEIVTHMFKERRIFVNGEITQETASSVAQQLLYLGQKTEPIQMLISSPGGEVNAGLMIYDVMQAIEAPVETYCMGMAASMAAILFAAGERGSRYILPHSQVMIHEPLIPGGVGGSASSIRNVADSIMKTRETLNQILAKHTGESIETIDAATAHDHYLNAEEAIAFGICDQIVEHL